MRAGLFWAFWGLALFLIVVPGPDWAFVLACGVRDRVVLPAVGGLMIGYALITVVVAAGVGAAVARTPIVLYGLTVVGAAYLIYLGASLLARPSALHAPVGTFADNWPRRILRGVGVSALNPKGLLIFLAMLPQFTDPAGAWPLAVQICALGSIFVLTCGVFYSILGLGTRAVLRARPAVSRLVSRISGTAMIVIGILLLADRLIPALASR